MIVSRRKKRKIALTMIVRQQPLRVWLVVAVLALGVLGYSLSAQSTDPVIAQDEAALYPELKAAMNRIRTIEVRRHNATVRINQQGGQWRVPDANNFPAQFGMVRQLVLTLADAKVIEPKTARRELFHHLHLDDIDKPDSQAVQVRLLASDESVIANVLVGKAEAAPTGRLLRNTFVRKAGEDQALLITGIFTLPAQAIDWVDRDLVHLDAQRVESVSLSPLEAGQDFIVLRRETPFSKDIGVSGLPQEAKPAPTAALQPVVAALAFTRFDDVMPFEDLKTITPRRVVTFTSFDGMTITATLYEFKAQHWVTLQAAWQAAPSPETWMLKAPEGFTGSLPLRDPTSVSREVQRLNSTTKDWAFRLDENKIKGLLLTPAELTQRGT